jgi:D-beta-D-heptose 7-phosphate kinase/D-beta-D-heptose 1-phosphate adenosyltransferase
MRTLDFSNATVLVVGDVMVDQYHFGAVHRISPEAPVPVVKVDRSSVTLGGAGNVVNNISHLGGKAVLLGFIGKDANGAIVARLLDEIAIQSALIETRFPTSTKVRVIGAHQQIVRLDFEEIATASTGYSVELLKHASNWIDKVDAVVISDYGKGVCDDQTCQGIIKMATAAKIPVLVDSKGDDWNKYRHAMIVKPNVKEFAKALGRTIRNEDTDIEKYGREALHQYQLNYLLVTRSEKGMSLISEKEIDHFHTEAREVFDVSGAGDAVAATLALALASGIDLNSSIKLANQAAGIVVSKVGTAPVEYDELMLARYGYAHKVVDSKYLSTYADKLRRQNKKIVFTSGEFARLRKSHIACLREAKRLGDVLVVGIRESPYSSDKLSEPIDHADTVEIVSALEFVDCVVVLDQPASSVLQSIAPDVFVIIGESGDADFDRAAAGDVVVMPLANHGPSDSAVDEVTAYA